MREILDTEFPARKSQVLVYQMPHNSGQAKVRMQGISMATGEYIIHCDSDDEVDKDAYRLLYEMAVAEKADIVTCDYNKVLFDGRIEYCSLFSKKGEEVSDIMAGKVWGTLCCRMIRRQILKDIIPPVGNMWEDMVLTIQAVVKCRCIGYLPVPFYRYYQRSDSICYEDGLLASLRRWADIYANAQLILSFLAENQLVRLNDLMEISFKYRCRSHLLPYVHIPEYYKKWRNTFPEIDREYLWARGISLEDKFWFVLIHLHLYHFVKMITGRLRRGN